MRTAEYAAPERVLLHLSDTHLRAAGSRLFDLVDARGPAAVDDAADDPELRELVEFLLVGAGARQ